MSHERAIDGEEPLFDFDGLESGGPPSSPLEAFAEYPDLADMSHIPHFSRLNLSSFSAASTPAEIVDSISRTQALDDYGLFEEEPEDFKGKGKAVSRPMDILPRDSPEMHFDLFSFSSASAGSSRGRRIPSVPSSSVSTAQTHGSFAFSPGATPCSFYGSSVAASHRTEITTPGSYYAYDMSHGDEDEGKAESSDSAKGKARVEAPVLPPLSFGSTEFAQGETSWPIQDYPIVETSLIAQPSASPVQFPTSSGSSQSEATAERLPFVYRIPSRTRSFSSLSAKSAKSFAVRSATKIKLSFGTSKRPSNLARRLLLRKCDDVLRLEPEESAPSNTPVSIMVRRRYSSFSEPSTPFHLPPQQTPAELENVSVSSIEFPEAPSDLFDEMLPKEIKLQIFKALIRLHELEGDTTMQASNWTALKASKNECRWMGRNKGFIDLVRISRVSKSWQRLAFDGELWVNLDLQAFPLVPSHLLRRLATTSGSFVRSVDLNGHTRLSPASLIDITNALCIHTTLSEQQFFTTQLTRINLSGCSAISTHALHDILIHSPLLLNLNLKGISAVTNGTCQTLATYCPALLTLDVTRCYNMDADGIKSFIDVHNGRGTIWPVKELRVSGLKRVNDRLLSSLGRFAPNLEVLDLSGARELHNSAIEAYVTCTVDEIGSHVALLSSREAGRDPGDPMKYKRRVTELRHLSLSSCPLLSDIACAHLAYALPKLEYLELAGIGSELRDEGLIHLLETTPLIRRLDLEEACDITDATLSALTPRIVGGQSADLASGQPGSQLEQLNLSYAVQLTNDAVLSLIRACTRLKRIELDNTRVNGATVKEFVRLSRKRQATAAEIVAVDCRGVGESTVKDLVGSTRTRKGWRAWDARKLHYLDSRDEEGLGVGQDECDARLVALKTFYSWQTVDAVETAREKSRRANKIKKNGHASQTGSEEDYFSVRRSSSKWWSPGARRASGFDSPFSGSNSDREGCIIM